MKEKEQERLFKALGNSRRLSIIRLIRDKGALTVGEIARKIKLSFKSTSRHLAVLYGVDILEKKQIGLQVFYRLSKDLSQPVLSILSIV